jgi:hypothetical protein
MLNLGKPENKLRDGGRDQVNDTASTPVLPDAFWFRTLLVKPGDAFKKSGLSL